MKKIIDLIVLCITIIFLTSCFGTATRVHNTSLVDYLYPNQKKVKQKPVTNIPHLNLPLRVGVAFVPGNSNNYYSPVISEYEKDNLAKITISKLKEYDFIKKIELIPSSYLMKYGGFENLRSLKRMFDIDVVVLISYNQVQNTNEGFSTFSYLTIIGAYAVKGEKNDTNTLIDAAVFDIDSQKLLFRAPGTSFVKGKSTLINLDEQLIIDRKKGFELAAGELSNNLKNSLEEFRIKIKENPNEVKISYRNKNKGAGYLDFVYSLLACLLLFFIYKFGKIEKNINK